MGGSKTLDQACWYPWMSACQQEPLANLEPDSTPPRALCTKYLHLQEQRVCLWVPGQPSTLAVSTSSALLAQGRHKLHLPLEKHF